MNFLSNNQQTMSSREIAELAGKRHSDILEAIRNMEGAWKKINGRKFPLVEYKDAKGEMRPEYRLYKAECLYVATKFNDEARAKLILRWEKLELEKQNQIPQSFSEALKLAYEQSLKIEEQQKQLEAQAPKVLFTEAVIGSSSSCLIGELAKIITQNGYEIGEKRLFKYMRENRYLGQKGERYNIPNQQYIEQGLFELKKGTRSGNNGVMHTTITTKVTGKGQVYFVNKFLATAI